MVKIDKFTETAQNTINSSTYEEINKPTPSAVDTVKKHILPLHTQIEEDGVALLRKLKQAGIDFEVFLRGLHQRVESGLV